MFKKLFSYLQEINGPLGGHGAVAPCQAQVGGGALGHHAHVQVAPRADARPLINNNRKTVSLLVGGLQLFFRGLLHLLDELADSNRHPELGLCMLMSKAAKGNRQKFAGGDLVKGKTIFDKRKDHLRQPASYTTHW